MSPKQMMMDFSFNADRADVIEQATRIYLIGMKHSNSSQIHVPQSRTRRRYGKIAL